MLKKSFKCTIFILLLAALFTITACSDDTPAVVQQPPGADTTTTGAALTELPAIWDVPSPELDTMAGDFKTTELLQLSPLTRGELLVTMHTSMGDITMRFFPTEAPQAVENFLRHAWDGYYDGLTFHRVMPNFMMQGGCPDGTGMAGQSIWGETFGQELSPQLRHFRGALAMAQSSMPNSIGSQFYIVQATDVGGQMRAEFAGMLETQDEFLADFPDGSYVTNGCVFPTESLRYFLDNGGTPFLDWHFSQNPHTVFGHVVSGMDVVDAIVAVEVEGGGDANPFQHRPVEPVLINGFTFFEHEGGA